MQLTLICLDADGGKTPVTVNSLPAVIGRNPECQIRLTDRWTSRQHCSLECNDGTITVRDLGSKHGTLINGRLISQASLNAGDKLTVGLTTFVLGEHPHGLRPEYSRSQQPIAPPRPGDPSSARPQHGRSGESTREAVQHERVVYSRR